MMVSDQVVARRTEFAGLSRAKLRGEQKMPSLASFISDVRVAIGSDVVRRESRLLFYLKKMMPLSCDEELSEQKYMEWIFL